MRHGADGELCSQTRGAFQRMKGDHTMSAEDKIKATADKVSGQAKGTIRDKLEDVKDVFTK